MYKLFANDCTSSMLKINLHLFWTPYMYLTTTIFCIHTPINKKKVIISLAAKSASDKKYIYLRFHSAAKKSFL